MDKTVSAMSLEYLCGKKCRIESKEGGVRVERVHKIKYQRIDVDGFVGDRVAVLVPEFIFFDADEVDGFDVGLVKTIGILE